MLSPATDSIDIEYREQEYGPFRPVAAPTLFGEYNHHEKSEKEQVADNIVELSKHIALNLPENLFQLGGQEPLNINTHLFLGRKKQYNSSDKIKLKIWHSIMEV